LFLNTYLIGDGSICEAAGVYGTSVNRVFYTVSPILAAQIGELIVKAGGFPSYRLQDNSLNPQFIAGREVMSNYEVYRIRWCISAGSTFGKNGKGVMKFVPYDGDTFCLTLERNHIFYSRRNGKCIWTGNCRGMLTAVGKVLPLDAEMPDDEKPIVDKVEFDVLGLKVNEDQVKLWRDKLNGVTPSILLALASDKTPDVLLAHAIKEGKVHSLIDLLSMTISKKFLKFVLGKTQYKFDLEDGNMLLEGSSSFTKDVFGRMALNYLRKMYAVGKEAGMKSLKMVITKDPYIWAKRGFYPSSLAEWEKAKDLVKGRYMSAGLSQEVKDAIEAILKSDNPADMGKLVDLDIPKDLLKDLVWSGTLQFDDTASMEKFLTYLSE